MTTEVICFNQDEVPEWISQYEFTLDVLNCCDDIAFEYSMWLNSTSVYFCSTDCLPEQ